MARELRIYERPSTLERPVLIGAFRGWNDGGQAATLAAGYLARLWGARKFADIDPELFVDFQATRPMVSLDEGRTRKIEWPENTFFRARIPDAGRVCGTSATSAPRVTASSTPSSAARSVTISEKLRHR